MLKTADTSSGEPPLTSGRPAVVLDTNVVLDWLLFADMSVTALAAAVVTRQVRWLATASMRDELAAVLHRGLADEWHADPAELLAAWDAHATLVPPAPAHRLHCTDPDDQKFIDLALCEGARWLVSRDRALLRLRRPALVLGLAVVKPQGWLLWP
jgi:putative PIN family toxin of toxin-antitoxin system